MPINALYLKTVVDHENPIIEHRVGQYLLRSVCRSSILFKVIRQLCAVEIDHISMLSISHSLGFFRPFINLYL